MRDKAGRVIQHINRWSLRWPDAILTLCYYAILYGISFAIDPWVSAIPTGSLFHTLPAFIEVPIGLILIASALWSIRDPERWGVITASLVVIYRVIDNWAWTTIPSLSIFLVLLTLGVRATIRRTSGEAQTPTGGGSA